MAKTTKKTRAVVDTLLDRYGRTYAEEAGIKPADRPSPLYQLLVLTTVLSARISADIAVAAARELYAAGYRTPKAMLEATWQDRVDALGRGHYKRYDERTATMLGDAAELLLDRWHGDLRRLREEANGDDRRLVSLLTEFPGIGPAGADIFLREVQVVWPEVSPHFGKKVADGADAVGLPSRESELADLTDSDRDTARLAAALIRVARSGDAAEEVLTAARA